MSICKRSVWKFRVRLLWWSIAVCAPNLYQCDNGQCVRRAEVCDGQNDCGDLTDERNCGTYNPYMRVCNTVAPTK